MVSPWEVLRLNLLGVVDAVDDRLGRLVHGAHDLRDDEFCSGVFFGIVR
jgi:hypothetical protein